MVAEYTNVALYNGSIYVDYYNGKWSIHSAMIPSVIYGETAAQVVTELQKEPSYYQNFIKPIWFWSEKAFRQFFVETGEFPDEGEDERF